MNLDNTPQRTVLPPTRKQELVKKIKDYNLTRLDLVVLEEINAIIDEADGVVDPEEDIKPTMELKQVIVIPKDVRMSPDKLGVQIAHASVTVILENLEKRPILMDWYENGSGQKKVVLEIETTEQLQDLYDKARGAGIPCCLIRDAGRTELKPGTITALGFFPMKNEDINPYTGSLKLHRHSIISAWG